MIRRRRKDPLEKEIKKLVGKRVRVRFNEPHLLGNSITADLLAVKSGNIVLLTASGSQGRVSLTRVSGVDPR